jgi:hypothetical protein
MRIASVNFCKSERNTAVPHGPPKFLFGVANKFINTSLREVSPNNIPEYFEVIYASTLILQTFKLRIVVVFTEGYAVLKGADDPSHFTTVRRSVALQLLS